MEMHADGGGAVEPGRQREGLAQASVLSSPGYQDALARDCATKLALEAEAVRLHCKGHKLSPRRP
jgi:hypothetical protein